MTNVKKKQKLRNNEYYNLQETFDSLYAKSKRNYIFTSLMDLITSRENIQLAYRNLRKNDGSYTAGVDGKNIEHLQNWEMDKLISHIQRKFNNYSPQPVRRVEIPKPNGKTRPLGIPTIMDRIIQQCILQVLEPICEAKFHKKSNGFRPNKSTENAIAQMETLIQLSNHHIVVDIDIKGFFDNVLNELDWWIASQWEFFPLEENKRKNKNYYLKNSKLKRCYIVRYADDFKIICKKKSDAEKLFIATKDWLKERLGLEISPEKSKIVNLRKHYSEFLGFKIKVKPKRKKYVIKSCISDKAKMKIKANCNKAIENIQNSKDDLDEIMNIQKYNSTIIGIHNYYQIATMVCWDLGKIAYEVSRTMYVKLRKRVNRKCNKVNKKGYVYERYRKEQASTIFIWANGCSTWLC